MATRHKCLSEEIEALKRYEILALVQNRFEGRGLDLFDEPETARSPQRLLNYLLND